MFVTWPMNPAATAAHACREDPGLAATETTVLAAAVASLGAVAVFLAGGSSGQIAADVQAALTVVSVALAWATVQRSGANVVPLPAGGVDGAVSARWWWAF